MLREAPELQTARLRLTPHRLEDLDDSLALWSSPEVTRFIGGRASTREEVWSRLLRYGGLWPMLGFGYWAVRDRLNGSFIGEVGFADFGRQTEPPMPGGPEMGWALRPQFWHCGYARESITVALGWLDTALPGRTARCIIDAQNVRSVAIAQRHGFECSGEIRYRSVPLQLYVRTARVAQNLTAG